MRRLIVIAAVLLAIFAAPVSRTVCAQEVRGPSELLDVLSSVKKGEQIRLLVSGTERPQSWRFDGLTGDTLLLKAGRLDGALRSRSIDSLWVREGQGGSSSGFMVGGAIGAMSGAIAGSLVYEALNGFMSPSQGSDPTATILGFAAFGGMIGCIGGALATSGGEWTLRYPVEASGDGSNRTGHKQSTDRLRLGIRPDPGIGVHVAASYTF